MAKENDFEQKDKFDIVDGLIEVKIMYDWVETLLAMLVENYYNKNSVESKEAQKVYLLTKKVIENASSIIFSQGEKLDEIIETANT